jgi:hypothetical protein
MLGWSRTKSTLVLHPLRSVPELQLLWMTIFPAKLDRHGLALCVSSQVNNFVR